MALTQEDQKFIKETINGAVENLAQIVAKGFEETATKKDIARLELEIAKINAEILEIKERITCIERDIVEIRKGLISRIELEDIWARLSLIEKKLGIESGK